MSRAGAATVDLISWRRHGPLLGLVGLHAVAAIVLWRSGSPAGTWQFECAVGALGWDLAHGLNPQYALSDYYDSWTSGYLLTGFLEAPLMALPWRPVLAVKATALLLQAGTVGLAWLFLWRNVGPWAARVGAAALTFCPPLLWFYSLHAGDYHYTELIWAFGVACLVGEIVRQPGRSARWTLGLGLVCGLAITNSFGSLAHVAACLALVVLLAPGQRTFARLGLLVAGLLTGAGPILYKLLLHRPFGVAAGEGSYHLPYTSGSWTLRLARMKLEALPRGFAANLGFGDGLHRFVEPGAGLQIGFAWTAVVVAGVLVVAVLARRDGLRLLLPLSLLAWLAAFVAVTSVVVARPPEVDEYLDARYLPPIVGLLAANLGVAAQALIDLKPGRLAPALVGVVVAPLLGVCLLSWSGLHLGTDLSDGGIPYRGRCYDMLGLYSSRHVEELPDDEGADRWVPQELCAGFGEEVSADCFLGRVMGVAMKRLDQVALRSGDPATFAPPADLVRSCDALPDGWRRDCYRHAGWTLNWPAQFHPNQRGIANLKDFCRAFGPGPEEGWCLEGAGYHLAGHYGPLPWKLPGLLPDDRESALHAMRGFGFHLAHTYAEPEPARRFCRVLELEEGLRAACVEGVGAGFAVYDRDFPPWAATAVDVQGDGRPADVVLVVVDSLRVDRTTALHPALDTTPRLAELGRSGTVYSQAVSPSSWSWLSIGALLTGLPVDALEPHGRAGGTTLAEVLAGASYRTMARVADPTLAGSGLARGFQDWEEPGDPAPGERRADRLIDAALEGLGEPDPRPLFLYVHMVDLHPPSTGQEAAPAEKRAGWSGGRLADVEGGWARSLGAADLACLWDVRSRYDAGVAATDAAVGRLLDGLHRARPRPRIVAVTSNHGLGLFSHPVQGVTRRRATGGDCDDRLPGRYRGHGEQGYEEALRVPLWLAGPGVEPGRIEERQVGMADLGGTLLRLAGVSTGRRQLPLSDAEPARTTVSGVDAAGWFVRSEELKLVVPRPGRGPAAPRLFEVEADRFAVELEDLASTRVDDVTRMRAELADWRARAASAADGPEAAVQGR